MFSKWGMLNAFLTHNSSNLQRVYLDITSFIKQGALVLLWTFTIHSPWPNTISFIFFWVFYLSVPDNKDYQCQSSLFHVPTNRTVYVSPSLVCFPLVYKKKFLRLIPPFVLLIPFFSSFYIIPSISSFFLSFWLFLLYVICLLYFINVLDHQI